MSNILLFFLVAIWALSIVKDIPTTIALNSSSSRLRWLRRLTWGKALTKMREAIHRSLSLKSKDLKVASYTVAHVRKSIGFKRFYINNGFDETLKMIMYVVEKYQRFVDEYRYNTFDNLDAFEEEFIENFLRQERMNKYKNK